MADCGCVSWKTEECGRLICWCGNILTDSECERMVKGQVRHTPKGAIRLLKNCNYKCFLTLVDLCEKDVKGSKSDLKRLAKAFLKAHERISSGELSLVESKKLDYNLGFIGARLFKQAKPKRFWT